MHELSIAMSIVDLATEICNQRNVQQASKIGLVIGELSGLEMQSFDFVWPVAVKGTVLEKSEREIITIYGKARCIDCENIFQVKHHYDQCPVCKGFLKEILQGKELQVKYIEIGN